MAEHNYNLSALREASDEDAIEDMESAEDKLQSTSQEQKLIVINRESDLSCRMKFQLVFITLMCVRNSQHQQIKHEHIDIQACSDTEDKEGMIGPDGEVDVYADFVKQKEVSKLPPFADPIVYPRFYDAAVRSMEACRRNLQVFISDFEDEPIPQAAPQTSIYSRDDVELGSDNILICHSTRFSPPPVHMQWTKNGLNVTDQATVSQYYPNKDLTFNQFSHLPFTPQEGDIYTCTVNHKALQMPDTKIWDVDVERPSVGPAVFCGVGLVVGLLGVATGTFFLIKGNQHN